MPWSFCNLWWYPWAFAFRTCNEFAELMLSMNFLKSSGTCSFEVKVLVLKCSNASSFMTFLTNPPPAPRRWRVTSLSWIPNRDFLSFICPLSITFPLGAVRYSEFWTGRQTKSRMNREGFSGVMYPGRNKVYPTYTAAPKKCHQHASTISPSSIEGWNMHETFIRIIDLPFTHPATSKPLMVLMLGCSVNSYSWFLNLALCQNILKWVKQVSTMLV